MRKLHQQIYSLFQLFFLINITTSFNHSFGMSLFYNTVYISTEDKKSPITIEYYEPQFCCNSSYLMKKRFPLEWGQNQEIYVAKNSDGRSTIKFCTVISTSQTDDLDITVVDLEELIISAQTKDNEIIIQSSHHETEPARTIALYR